MPAMQGFTTTPDVEFAHLTLDPAWVVAPSTAHAEATTDFGQHSVAPDFEALRGEGPRLAAVCA
jgi:hypothetical protein